MKTPVVRHSQLGVRVQHRLLNLDPATADDDTMSVGMVITTPTPVRTWIPDPSYVGPSNGCPYVEGDEVLLASGLDYSRTVGMPLLDSHDSSRSEMNLGRVDNVLPEGENVVGLAVFRPSKADIYADVKAGFLRQVSAGYCVAEYTQIERTDGVDVPMFAATRWTLLETSLVAVGADPNATIRSQTPTQLPMPIFKRSATDKDSPMADTTDTNTLASLVAAALAAVKAVAAAEDDGSDAATTARAAKLRAAADEDMPDDGSDNDPDDDGDSEDTEDGERAALKTLRSIAGERPGMTKLVDDLVALGSGSRSIRKALKTAVIRSAGAPEAQGFKHATSIAAEPTIDTRSIYAAANNAGRKAK